MTSSIDRREFLVSAGAVMAGGWAASTSPAADRPEPADGPGATRPKLPFRVSRETTRITEPLRPDGSPDYVAALDAAMRQGVTPENNAAVLYLRAIGPGEIPEEKRAAFFAKLGIDPLPAEGEYLATGHEDAQASGMDFLEWEKRFDLAAEAPWRRNDLPLVAKVLDRNDLPLRLVVEGTRRPRLYVPLVDAAPDELAPLSSAALLLTPAFELRGAARLLVRRAMLRLGEGSPRAAEDDLLACHRLARNAARRSFMIDRLVASALDAIAQEGDLALARHGGMSGDELVRFGTRLAELPAFPPVVDVFALGERYFQLDGSIGMIRGRRDIFETLEVFGDQETLARLRAVVDNAEIDWNVVLIRENEFHDRLVDVARTESVAERRRKAEQIARLLQSMKQRTEKPIDELKRLAQKKDGGHAAGAYVSDLLLACIAPISIGFLGSEDRRDAHFDLTRLAVALAAFRADHGRYPTALADLLPKHITKIPADLFSENERPPIYRRDDDGAGYLLYSVGPNGEDEGGRTPHDDPSGDDLVVTTRRHEAR
ncbi:MAG: hypothetical protein WD069_21715 [Planctomycetales bacterium]